MRCPKCDSEFETFTCGQVVVDRCLGCGGLWLDAHELERLGQIPGAAHIDHGDRRVGRRYNELQNVACPRCGVRMFRMTDDVQLHIEYEFCPDCSGTFFDAGEFRDLSELTIAERLKKLADSWLSVR